MRNMKLHTRMVLAALLLTSAMTLCLDIAGVYIIRNYMMERFKGRITFLARYLAVNSEVGVLIRDKTGLNSLAVNLLGEEDVALVSILDSEGQVLVEQSRDIKGKLYTVETEITLNKTDEENMLFTRYHETPFGTLRIKGVEKIGKVRIQYSTRGINRLVEQVTRQFVMVSVLLMVLAGILFYFMVKTIVTEVTQLATVSRMIRDGNQALRAEPGNLPETRKLASAFNSMLDALEQNRKAYERMTKEAAQQKSLAELGKFSLSVAHEVKNPLAIIKSAFEFLKNEYRIDPENTMSEYIEDEITRLNRLIEDFLVFAKPGNITFSDITSAEFLDSLMKRCQVLYDESPVQAVLVSPAPDVDLRADPHLLTRALDNIIKNAIEASGEAESQGPVEIRSWTEDSFWFVSVTDQGTGIEQGKEKEIFEPFYTTKSKGTGLGLALAYQIISAHNGMMTAENSSKAGAVFTMGIPMG